MLSILIGALTSQLSSSLLLGRSLASRAAREATVQSAINWDIYQLQHRTVPAVCARDTIGPSSPTSQINGSWATVTQSTCTAIVPDQKISLDSGNYPVDGTYDSSRNAYVVADLSGNLRSYPFGQTAATWVVPLGGSPTGPALVTSNSLAMPGGSGVAFYDYSGSQPIFRCNLGPSGRVAGSPARGSSNFPRYTFFADAAQRLYAYNAPAGGGCSQLPVPVGALLGSPVGATLVFQGAVTNGRGLLTKIDDIFVLTTTSTSTYLEHWQYSESADNDNDCFGPDCTSYAMTRFNYQSLTGALGGQATGYALSSATPPLSLVAASRGGGLAIVRIGSGTGYSMSGGPSTSVPGSITGSPYWCSSVYAFGRGYCPGQDLIGVGSTNNTFYVYSSGLNLPPYQFSGPAAINSTPVADAYGDWYFGADDGNVYDVEVPASGSQLFMAAKFGPGGAVGSSPIEAPCQSGAARCVYFGTSTWSYFALIGDTRTMDMRACVTNGRGSASCANNPAVWARVTVGPGAGNPSGVSVRGWSYYSPVVS
jgi:hypothetical protein